MELTPPQSERAAAAGGALSPTPSRPAAVAVFGSTGSVGRATLDVIRHHPARLRVSVLAAGGKLDDLIAQVIEFRPDIAVIAHPGGNGNNGAGPSGPGHSGNAIGGAGVKSGSDARELLEHARKRLKSAGVKTELWDGEAALVRAAREAGYDIMLGAITGAAGLPANIEAVRRGKRLALANKESLVMTGPILTRLARETGALLAPVDSEHSAVWQCLRGERHSEIRRVILTASGGPFRTTPLADLARVTREQALAHPTWRMGPKITIDSATMMNKALEIIEARWLFDLRVDQLGVLIHPQSVVHSMVEFADRSIMAQLGPTDMRIPIQLALTWPERLDCPVTPADSCLLANLTFEELDIKRFPAIGLGFKVAAAGATLPAVFNAANEAAVSRFLSGEIGYLDVYRIVEAVTHAYGRADTGAPAARIGEPDLDDVMAADRWARDEALKI